MKFIAAIAVALVFASCGSGEEEVNPDDPVSEKTEEKLEEIQEENIAIEKLDGQLDSLLNEIE